MNNFGNYNRRACQRCHAQKLSCRPETQTECSRCIKANAKCVARSSLRIRKGNSSSESRSQLAPHSSSGNDKSESDRPITDFPIFSDATGGSTSIEDTTTGANERSHMNTGESYSSIIPSSQWFTDMVATDTHICLLVAGTEICAVASNLPVGPDDLAYETNNYATTLCPVDTSDSTFGPLGYPVFLLSQQEISSTSLNISLVEALSTASGNELNGFCKKSWVEELARLNSRLCSHEQPVCTDSPGYMTSGRSRSCSLSTESDKPLIDSPICLDDALTHTKDLIKLLDSLSSHKDPSAHNEMAQSDGEAFRNVFQDLAPGASPQHLDISVSNTRMSIPNVISEDPFTILLFMACYVRLIGIYKALFERIQAVINEEGPEAASPLLLRSQLPRIVVGPFSLRSNPNLEVMLIIELVRFVIGRIGQAARLMTPGATGCPSRDLGCKGVTPEGTQSMDQIIVSTLNTIKGSEQVLLGAIHGIRDIMTQKYLSPNVTFT
ncbi:hypothetical protein DE146DRAFT_774507 [Phaeosphaeria sp. MPI-PUGE-AT-0046c]|nr:hypothetical protein DE146DRAFT_774507 [Phaeosphaeria sp. MPI-PUGE-AT-0046c]